LFITNNLVWQWSAQYRRYLIWILCIEGLGKNSRVIFNNLFDKHTDVMTVIFVFLGTTQIVHRIGKKKIKVFRRWNAFDFPLCFDYDLKSVEIIRLFAFYLTFRP
jgi:hypothetical protein